MVKKVCVCVYLPLPIKNKDNLLNKQPFFPSKFNIILNIFFYPKLHSQVVFPQ